MALWFAVIRVREMMQKSAFSTKYANNRWTTNAQRATRYTVNLDEEIQAQWEHTYG
jgi:hypothetical protein